MADRRGDQGVKVRVSRHYDTENKKTTITRIHMPVAELGKLVTVVTAALQKGLGVNKQGELQLFLTNYDSTLPTSKGRLGIVRSGFREAEKGKLQKKIA